MAAEVSAGTQKGSKGAQGPAVEVQGKGKQPEQGAVVDIDIEAG